MVHIARERLMVAVCLSFVKSGMNLYDAVVVIACLVCCAVRMQLITAHRQHRARAAWEIECTRTVTTGRALQILAQYHSQCRKMCVQASVYLEEVPAVFAALRSLRLLVLVKNISVFKGLHVTQCACCLLVELFPAPVIVSGVCCV